MSLSSSKPLVWFITGTSQGFGRELVRAALQRGDSVVATSRNPQTVTSVFPARAFVCLPGWGIYNSPKFAVEGLSEALAVEGAPLGIGVTIVEPGPFRTDFLGGSLGATAKILPDYKETAGQPRAAAATRHGNQPGDPALAADAILKAVTAPNQPRPLPLG